MTLHQSDEPTPAQRPRAARRSPLHQAVSDEAAARLWAQELKAAETDEDARRFVLKYKSSTPPPAIPNVPAVPWPRIRKVEDLNEAIDVLLRMHAEGELDAPGLVYLAGILRQLAGIFETTVLAPQVHEIRARLDAMGDQ